MSGKRGVWVPLKGVHRVRRKLADGSYREHFYAWRGGPKLDAADLEGSYKRAMAARDDAAKRAMNSTTVAAKLVAFRSSPKFMERAPRYRRDSAKLHQIIAETFGAADVAVFCDPRIRAEVYKLRDQRAHTPRAADLLTGEITAFANWLHDQSHIEPHCVKGIHKLHKANRADIIWTPEEIDAVCRELPGEYAAVVRIAALTGLDLPDLLALTWTQVRRFSIRTERAKTGQLALPILLPEAARVFDGIPKNAVHVFLTARGRPITVSGFRTLFGRAKAKLAIAKRFKDLRGTAATNYVRAGVKPRELPAIMGWEKKWVDQIILHYVTGEEIAQATVERIVDRTVNGGVNGTRITDDDMRKRKSKQ